jgi:hypothetical protein
MWGGRRSEVDRTRRNAASGGGVGLLHEAAGRAPHTALTVPTDTRHQKCRGFASRIERTCLAVDTCFCNVYKIASKAVWLGTVEAPDGAAAMEKAPAEFKASATG